MYGLGYPRATVVPRSAENSLYACVTIPDALRPLLNNRRQIYKSLFTPNMKEAYEGLSAAEAEIWRQLDQANPTNHQLAIAYKALVDVVLKGETSWPYLRLTKIFGLKRILKILK